MKEYRKQNLPNCASTLYRWCTMKIRRKGLAIESAKVRHGICRTNSVLGDCLRHRIRYRMHLCRFRHGLAGPLQLFEQMTELCDDWQS